MRRQSTRARSAVSIQNGTRARQGYDGSHSGQSVPARGRRSPSAITYSTRGRADRIALPTCHDDAAVFALALADGITDHAVRVLDVSSGLIVLAEAASAMADSALDAGNARYALAALALARDANALTNRANDICEDMHALVVELARAVAVSKGGGA